MAQEPIEIILLRQWASYVAIPIWLSDPEGNLIYYNEPAETLLGIRFEEVGGISAGLLSELFHTSDPDGAPLANSDLPLVVALTKQVPAHRVIRITGLDGSSRVLEVTALPIVGEGGRHLGAMATFWERQ